MRKKKSAKAQKFQQRMMAGIMLLVMFGMVVSAFPLFLFDTGAQGDKVNGFRITPVTQGYNVEGKGYNLLFQTSPNDAASVAADKEAMQRITKSRALQLTSNYTDGQAGPIAAAQYGISRLATQEGKFVTTGFTTPQEGFAQVDCSDATEGSPVILFQSANTSSSIALEGNCVIVQGRGASSLSLIGDRIAYELIGVLPNEN